MKLSSCCKNQSGHWLNWLLKTKVWVIKTPKSCWIKPFPLFYLSCSRYLIMIFSIQLFIKASVERTVLETVKMSSVCDRMQKVFINLPRRTFDMIDKDYIKFSLRFKNFRRYSSKSVHGKTSVVVIKFWPCPEVHYIFHEALVKYIFFNHV